MYLCTLLTKFSILFGCLQFNQYQTFFYLWLSVNIDCYLYRIACCHALCLSSEFASSQQYSFFDWIFDHLLFPYSTNNFQNIAFCSPQEIANLKAKRRRTLYSGISVILLSLGTYLAHKFGIINFFTVRILFNMSSSFLSFNGECHFMIFPCVLSFSSLLSVS